MKLGVTGSRTNKEFDFIPVFPGVASHSMRFWKVCASL
jgi:hypothetical protein